ncbi:MAG: Asp-tRNA(Asn)/Glu-tRNA(Gln) amidotransferase subunit GatC [Candidatus Angelobacter sp.]
MKVTDKDVTYVADLANLELTDQEHRRMLKDLNSILEYIDRLNELDTANVPSMAQVSSNFSNGEKPLSQESSYAWRDDVIRPSLPHTEALRNAPETDGDFFKVPRVIEK